MNTLVTPLQVLKLAFGEGEYLPPEIIAEADIAGAEQRYIVPVVGRALYEKLLAGSYPDFRTEYLASPAALFTPAKAASMTASGEPTNVTTVRLVASPGSTSSSLTPPEDSMADVI